MAVVALLSNGTYTTGTWNRIEAFSWDVAQSSSTRDDLGTLRTLPVTFANGGDQQGIFLNLYVASASLGTSTLTIKLQENTGSWVDRTTNTFDTNSTVYDHRNHIKYFPLDTYTVDTSSNKWRYTIQNSSSSKLSWYRSSTAADYSYAVCLNASTSAPSSGDGLFIRDGYTFTVDQSMTIGAIDLNRAIVMGNDSTLSWVSPAASYTMTLNGSIFLHKGLIQIGTSASPISFANRAIIDISGTSSGYLIENPGSSTTSGYGGVRVLLYGAKGTGFATDLNTVNNASQPIVVSSTDLSSTWQTSDKVSVIGKKTTSLDNTEYTISSFSGTSITLNANLDYATIAGGAVVNATHADRQLGIKLIAPSYKVLLNGDILQLVLQGVYSKYLGVNARITHSYQSTNTNISLFDCILYEMGTGSNFGIYTDTTYTGTSMYNTGFSVTDFYVHSTGTAIDTSLLWAYGFNNSVLTNIYLKNGYRVDTSYGGGIYADGQSITITNVRISNAKGTSRRNLFAGSGSSLTLTNIHLIGGSIGITAYNNVSTYTNVNTQYNNLYGLDYEDGVGNTYINCNFGNVETAGTSDIFVQASIYADVIFKNTTVGTNGVSSMASLINGSTLKFHALNGTANNHKVYNVYGNFQSTGDSLADTTVHTSGTGKFGLRFDPLSSANNLTWDVIVPIGNIQNKTMTIAIWCKINNANYYAGTHELPRLTIDYDDGTTAYAQAGQKTDWQLLFITFTPTSTYSRVIATLSGKTDATGTDAYIYWDDWSILYPAGYALDLSGMDYWTDALPTIPPIATVTTAKDVWTASSTENYGDNTMGQKVKEKPQFIIGNSIIT